MQSGREKLVLRIATSWPHPGQACFLPNCLRSMDPILQHDLDTFETILDDATRRAKVYLESLETRPPSAAQAPVSIQRALPERGIGALAALEQFERAFAASLSGGAGPRYFSLVTGGATPAAVAGDWLVSAYDQNAHHTGDTCAPFVEMEAIELLKSLLGLPPVMTGSFLPGATMANVVGIALGRQYLGRRRGVDIAEHGVSGIPIRVFSAEVHASAVKALSLCGMGRGALETLPKLPGREAIDVMALEHRLAGDPNAPTIVIANAGTVNTADFDDLTAIAALRERYDFWLHVDAAFGGFAACAPEYAHFMNGVSAADSLTLDAHKWLNVPYDSAMQFTRHLDLQLEVFRSVSSYLEAPKPLPYNYVHLTPASSRRFRALPVWLSLLAYGRAGFREIVERSCGNAKRLETLLTADARFEVRAPVRLNVLCFVPHGRKGTGSAEDVHAFLTRLKEDGKVSCSFSMLDGVPIIRAAFCNWRTTSDDVDAVYAAFRRASQ